MCLSQMTLKHDVRMSCQPCRLDPDIQPCWKKNMDPVSPVLRAWWMSWPLFCYESMCSQSTMLKLLLVALTLFYLRYPRTSMGWKYFLLDMLDTVDGQAENQLRCSTQTMINIWDVNICEYHIYPHWWCGFRLSTVSPVRLKLARRIQVEAVLVPQWIQHDI